MRDEAFRAFLTPLISRAAVDGYLSNARAVERLLKIDPDTVDLSLDNIAVLKLRLGASGMPGSRASDCQSALRRYAQFRGGTVGPTAQQQPLPSAKGTETTSPVSARAPHLTLRSVPDLMKIYADVLGELRHRGVLRTGNGPIGDYAEMLFAQAFGWSLAGNSTSGHDAVDEVDLRYQVKARRVGPRNPSRQLGALRRLPDHQFDVLAAVLFDEDVGIRRAALIPYQTVLTVARRVEHTNSWRVMLSDGVWSLPGVADVTLALRKIADGQAIFGVEVSG